MGERIIEVVPYDPAWPAQAAEAITDVREALAGTITEIEHIGSTAVPGLAAKPIIDLMAAAEQLAAVEAREKSLSRLGYRRDHNGMANRLLYVRGDNGCRTHHLHVVTLESWPSRNQRILRDHLRKYPADAARYAQLKQSLAAAGASSDTYTEAKTELIQELTDRARAERGLPAAPVWE
ncbi:GrpB family protein [Streptomyces rimosus]|uniref:GrpB family protein n=1 Tax=Streptomyces rimosus TaxID=1927 RepID=UPI0004C7DE41|nr:GrpB family protein [Streptomyces rimosus]